MNLYQLVGIVLAWLMAAFEEHQELHIMRPDELGTAADQPYSFKYDLFADMLMVMILWM